MAESALNTDESLLLPPLLTQSECEALLDVCGLFDDVSDDIVKEENFADGTCMQASQSNIYRLPCQVAQLSTTLPTATSDMPSTDEYPGPHNFEIQVDSRSAGKNWLFSSSLNKLYITVNKVIHLGFKCNPSVSDVYVRGLLIFTEAQYFTEPVVRCLVHTSPLDPTNTDIDRNLIEYVLHIDRPRAVYEKDVTSGRHSVRVALDNLQAGAEWVTLPIKFMCKNSCNGGMNRRSTEVIFTLENESGDVLGRRKMKVRICSCPKRDKDKEEGDTASKQNETVSGGKRKIASHPQRQNQDQQVAKRKCESLFQQTFLTRDDFLDATTLAHGRLERKLIAENRNPSDKEAMLLQKYKNDLNAVNEV